MAADSEKGVFITVLGRPDRGQWARAYQAISRQMRSFAQIEGTEAEPLDRLTPRETEVLEFIGRGASNEEIASRLEIHKRTVETHIRHIYSKLGVQRRSQAMLWAIQHGLALGDTDNL